MDRQISIRIQGNSVRHRRGHHHRPLGNGIGTFLAGDGNLVGSKADFASNNISGNHSVGIIG